jgi:hypothetical protein
MKITDSYPARQALARAIADIQSAASELSRPELSDKEKFEIAWKLGHVELQGLEEYRLPD